MPANRHRYRQNFPLVYVCIGITAIVCAASFAVKTLLVMQELKQDGERLGRLRKERVALESENRNLNTQKEKLVSLRELMKAIDKKFIKLAPIESRNVVLIDSERARVATAALQAVPGEGR